MTRDLSAFAAAAVITTGGASACLVHAGSEA
jgi:hypothetical protein